jgi:hypothetical protein
VPAPQREPPPCRPSHARLKAARESETLVLCRYCRSDDRNQFELTRTLPGGVDALREVVAQLHARGVKVLWAYNPWDHSTRGSEHSNVSDPLNLAKL